MSSSGPTVSALIGPARSGTTWIGSIVDSHPDVVYRFEPFHRLGKSGGELGRLRTELKEKRFARGDVAALHAALLRAHPKTDKAPFFRRKSYRQRVLGRELLWPAARAVPALVHLYRALYTPAPAHLVFKEVTFVKEMAQLLAATDVGVVYVARHPVATVMSDVRGQRSGEMPSGRQRHLASYLENHDAALRDRFTAELARLDDVQKTALLWRIEIEQAVAAVEGSARGLLMTYESFVDEPHASAAKMFAHFGLPMPQETADYLDALYSLDSDAPARGSREWGKKYFSVARNPQKQRDGWKARVDPEDRRKVEEVVSDSAAVAKCAAIGRWEL